jgi:hypothetical protein
MSRGEKQVITDTTAGEAEVEIDTITLRVWKGLRHVPLRVRGFTSSVHHKPRPEGDTLYYASPDRQRVFAVTSGKPPKQFWPRIEHPPEVMEIATASALATAA